MPLNQQERRDLQEREKARALEIENRRRKAKGLEPLNDVDAADDITERTHGEEMSDDPKQESEDDNVDPLLTEAGQILMDAMPAYQQARYALTPRRYH